MGLWLCAQATYALDLELTQGVSSALPIAVDSFGQDTSAQMLSEVIRNDLRLSGQFKLIPGPAGASAMMWRQSGADSVVIGQVRPIGAGRYSVHTSLLDTVTQGRPLLSRDFEVSQAELRPLAHFISDLVYEKLTGERGIFSTRIAYILVQHLPEGRTRYALEVADSDGYNPQNLLMSSEPIMSPAWSPDGRYIACVSFEKRKAQIYTIELATGRRRLITDFPGINGAPTWSPDGRSLALVLSKSGAPKIYKLDLSTGQMQQLTFGSSIDTEPRYTSDGQHIIFTSGRGGSPQVYQLSLRDNQITRLTYDGDYNARATLSPNRQYLVMLHRQDGHYNIAVQNMGQNTIMPLTHSVLDESPSISPNGRLVLYATREGANGELGVVSVDGRIRMRLPSAQGDIQEPAWSPYLG
ncbi:MAG: Tol-Pal system beta propeller repeat protein TolB [Legionellaceae bacterium]|nr:Tol-Pal system beta propeller repeat protein TolB [Legionellaceae bacterium]